MKLPILLYHKVDRIPPGARYPRNYVTPEQFDAQLALLRTRGYTGISVGDYLAYRRDGARLPRRPIIITFDDGYKSNRTVALPALARHGFRATVFAVAGLVGGTNAWDADERQEPLLDADDLRALQAAQVEIGSHTLTHARLPELPRGAVLAELRESRERLEVILGRPVRVLSYPYGAHSEETRRLAADGGFEAAVIVRRRMNTGTTDLYALRRIPIDCGTTLHRFAWDLFRLRWFYGS